MNYDGNSAEKALAPYLPTSARGGRAYADLHEHLAALAQAGLLFVVDRPVNKDTEIHPLVRWQYRGGIPEEQRKAFLFTRPTDAPAAPITARFWSAGLPATTPSTESASAAALTTSAVPGARRSPSRLLRAASTNPACQEIVMTGGALDHEGRGLDALPVPISTPGWDNAPYLSAGHYITKDPDTGVQNVGTYRGQIKGRRLLGMNASVDFLRAYTSTGSNTKSSASRCRPASLSAARRSCLMLGGYKVARRSRRSWRSPAVLRAGRSTLRAQNRRPHGAGGS